MTTKRGRILSGIRPTGPLHLGHLVGVLESWASLQDEYECFYMIADWHALMSEYHDSANIKEHTLVVAAECISCGIDPGSSVLFVQSAVPEHCQLHLILSTMTPVGWLERCPTYKEQLKELTNKDIHTYGFLGYPVLQAADILVYRADTVPVGEDQLAHLEITREIARRFNAVCGVDILPEPQAKVTRTARLLGTDRRKMSKSYDNFIALADAPDVIRKKVMSMITDPQRIKLTDAGRPEYCNVCRYWEVFVAERAGEVAETCRRARWGCTQCKRELADALIEFLSPIRERRAELLAAPDKLKEILLRGNGTARGEAARTMESVRNAIGF